MTVKEVQRLYDYAHWANTKLLQVVSQLTPDQFRQPVAGSYGSIQNTLVHVLSAEWGWLERCGGPRRGPALKPDAYPTAESLAAEWTTVEANLREFLANLSDDDLARTITFNNARGEERMAVLGELLQHGVVHGVHHRGQVALLLRLLGHTPGNVDLLFYDGERRNRPAW